ncbi:MULTISPECIES: hypothetical protein [unclassified Rhizobium]|uniref:hypothetical protein n=1 Tax=unclassified Rhizobium TaxID=2613769 RepID=UPI001C828417|nr:MULTISPECIES: hypothetical protein [unclassified Rhizobium]MBX5216167.1 hypothetical protein [Rhizobium sp. NLR9a]MBX5246867.1 hypothetical protein [Rhizobium sp. NLR3b]MBX5277469.1 hypothetical protein [Rhizobium sp. NLR13a]MBX5283550.1 hypothetical protein [Rhizobium sp. NLR10a]MBX5297007.1 hypothetical protein [Rhizobium sp. NLR15a]
MSKEAIGADRFLSLVAMAQERNVGLTSIQAGLLVAAELGIASDSRSFARMLGIAHALVLRDLSALTERDDKLRIVKRDPRTMRVHYSLAAL